MADFFPQPSEPTQLLQAAPPAAGKRSWYKRPGVLVPIGTGVLGLVIGTASAGGASTTSAAGQAATVTSTVTATSTAATVQPTSAPATVTATRTVKSAPKPVTNTVTKTKTVTADSYGGGAVYYANCTAARAAGDTPLYRGDPGYRAGLDRDNDGVACE